MVGRQQPAPQAVGERRDAGRPRRTPAAPPRRAAQNTSPPTIRTGRSAAATSRATAATVVADRAARPRARSDRARAGKGRRGRSPGVEGHVDERRPAVRRARRAQREVELAGDLLRRGERGGVLRDRRARSARGRAPGATPRPSGACGARPPMTSSGEPLSHADVIALTPFVTPGPAVSAATPGRRVTFAQPSAANVAVCSWRVSTRRMSVFTHPS